MLVYEYNVDFFFIIFFFITFHIWDKVLIFRKQFEQVPAV